MKNRRLVASQFLWVLFGLSLLGITGCTFNPSFPSLDLPYYQCETERWNCPKTITEPDVTLTGAPQVAKYQKGKGLWWDKAQAYQVYWDKPFSIWDIDLNELKGSLLIQTGHDDWGVSVPEFLKVEMLTDIENFYLAYDSRANPKPDWLLDPSGDYERVPDPLTYWRTHSYYVTITKRDEKTPPAFVKLEVFRRKKVPPKHHVITIPGNGFGNPGWQGITTGSPAMYLVLIAPKVRPDCSPGNQLDTMGFVGCFATQVYAEKAAATDCQQKSGPLACRNTSCQTPLLCAEGYTLHGGALTIQPRAFPYRSEIEFLAPQSRAEVTIKGKQFKSGVRGTLHFEYLLQTHDIQLNSMTLELDPLETDVGRFTDLAVTLLQPSVAHCQDALLVLDQPCDKYQIPKADFASSEGGKLKGKPLLFASENVNPIDIQIDHTTRTFQLTGGPLHTLMTIDGTPTPLDIAIDLTGHFVNFAPNAVASESSKFAECARNRNQTPVFLNAAGSFDIYDPLPTNPANYEWYEDYELVTQKLWGQGPKVTIGPSQLGFGVHTFTLVLRDKNGVVDTNTIKIPVQDTKPPQLTIPGDVVILQGPPAHPQQVDIGKAEASDACALEVMISDDAPAGLVFQPGETAVTWEADDGRGNTTRKVQTVVVTSLREPLMLQLKDIAVHLIMAANKSLTAIQECEAAPTCPVDLTPLSGAMAQLILHVNEMATPEGQERVRSELSERLDATMAALKEAEALVSRSNRVEREGRALRAGAIERLTRARDLVSEVMDLPRR